jgi:type IV pilus assembly protein PilV
MSPHISKRRATGMTLAEVLVTLLLVSTGLLGIAALQLTSLKSNQEAHVRVQATTLAADILDRMRANSNAARSGAYNVAFNGTGAAGTLAGIDLAAWQAQIDAVLPGGTDNAAGMVQVDGNNIATVTIRWGQRADRATMQEDELVTFVTRSEI